MEKTKTAEFKCKWSKEVITITVFALLVTLPMIFLLTVETFITSICLIFIYGVLGYYILMSPLKLIVDTDRIIIKRIFGEVSILIQDVLEIRRLTKIESTHSIRKWGSRGYFGYTGWFYSKSLGNHYMYATDMDNLIFIGTEKRNYIVSCSEPDEFLKTVKSFCDISR